MAMKLIYNNGPEVRKHGLRQFNVTKVADSKVAAILAELGDQIVVVDQATKKVEHCGTKVSAYFKMKFSIKDQATAPAEQAPVEKAPVEKAPVEDKVVTDDVVADQVSPEEIVDAPIVDDAEEDVLTDAAPNKRGRKKKDAQDAE